MTTDATNGEQDCTHRKFLRKALFAGVGRSFRFPPFAKRIKVLAVDAKAVTVLTGDGNERTFPRDVSGRKV
jgi:hypothetical protein